LVTEDEIIMMDKVIAEILPVIPRFQLTIKPSLNYLDISKLCEWSIDKLPKGLRFAFIAAQKVSLKAKKEDAWF
jgi:hypothetical protein